MIDEISWIDLSSPDRVKMMLDIQRELATTGIVFTKNARSEFDLISIGEALGEVQNPRHPTIKGIANIHHNPTLPGNGYTRDALLFHSDRSGFANPPKFLLTTVRTKATSGGLSTFVDGKKLKILIQKENPNLYKMLCDKNMSLFKQCDGGYCNFPFFDESTGQVRCRFDDQVAFSHPLAEQLPNFMHFLERLQLTVQMEEGEGYILDNHRWFHGRTAFEGKREVLRLLICNNSQNSQNSKLILFDIDGTLLDSQSVSVAAFFKCLTKILGKAINLKNSSSVNLHGQTDLNLVTQVVKLHMNQDQDLDEIIREFFSLHPIYIEEEIRSNKNPIIECPGVVTLFERIWESRTEFINKGIHFGLLTGNSKRNAFAKIRSVGIRTEIFDTSVSVFGDTFLVRSDMLPALWEETKKFGHNFDSTNTLIVGDTPLDVNCAKTNNAKVLAVATGSYELENLKKCHPDYTMQNLVDNDAVLKLLMNF